MYSVQAKYLIGEKKETSGMRHVICAAAVAKYRLKFLSAKDFKHLAYGYYSTSISAQSPTVDRVLVSLGSDAYPAGSMEQMLVSLSRAKESARIYTGDQEELKLHIIKSSQRGTATELLEGKLAGTAQPRSVASKVARTRELLQRQRAYKERLAQEEHDHQGVRYGTGYGR